MRTVRTRRDASDRSGVRAGGYGDRERRGDDREAGEVLRSSHCVRFSPLLLKVGTLAFRGNQLEHSAGTLSRTAGRRAFRVSGSRFDIPRAYGACPNCAGSFSDGAHSFGYLECQETREGVRAMSDTALPVEWTTAQPYEE